MLRALINPAKRILASMGISVRRQFETFVGEVPHSTLTPPASYSPWLADPEFRKTWHVIRDNSLVDVYRCYELWNLTGQVASLHGDFLEVGVWRGGTGCLLAERIRRLGLAAQIFLCDTFGGVVKAGIKDTDYVGGEHADTSRETVNRLASSLGLDNVVVLQGIFPDETGEAVADRALRFVHIDVDVYDSAKGVTDFVWPRLVSGGILVYDDYGFLECPGVTRYVNETHRGADRILIQNLNGHAIVVKR